MAVIKIKVSPGVEGLRQELEDLVGEFFHLALPLASSEGWRPAVNILDEGERLIVLAEMAGVKKEDCSVSIEGQVLRIRARRENPAGERTGRFLQMEWAYGPGERALKLPVPVKASEIEAYMENGLLVLKIPKEQARGDSIRIPIITGDGGT